MERPQTPFVVVPASIDRNKVFGSMAVQCGSILAAIVLNVRQENVAARDNAIANLSQ